MFQAWMLVAYSMFLAYEKAGTCGVRCFVKSLVEIRMHTDDSEHGWWRIAYHLVKTRWFE